MYYCDSSIYTPVFSLSTHRFPIPSEEARKDQSIGRSHWMCAMHRYYTLWEYVRCSGITSVPVLYVQYIYMYVYLCSVCTRVSLCAVCALALVCLYSR